MTAVMIGVDPHKGSHTAVVIDLAEVPLGELRVRASAAQARRLVEWAAAWPQRTWAVEGAGGLGHLLAQQLISAQPAHQPRHPHGRDHPDPAQAQRGPRLLRQESGRGKDRQRGAAVPQAQDQRRDLRPPPGRRAASRHRTRDGPGRATGERLCIQRGRLAPRTPALGTSHSRTRYHDTARHHDPHKINITADFRKTRLTT
jgi:hypothetical protein